MRGLLVQTLRVILANGEVWLGEQHTVLLLTSDEAACPARFSGESPDMLVKPER